MSVCLEESAHGEQLVKMLNAWGPKILKSKSIKFDRTVHARAWNLQVKCESDYHAGLRTTIYSLEKIFYVYVLMDPLKPGPFTYSFFGRKYTFPFEVFYVGKGKGDRVTDHGRWARTHPKPQKRQHKLNRIRKLHRLGLEPIEKKISMHEEECLALVKEMLLIEKIGRRLTKDGPLTNLTPGGEGGAGATRGHPVSEMTREKLRVSQTGRKLSEAHKAKISTNSPRRGKKNSPEHSKAIAESNSRRKGISHRTLRSKETRARLSAIHKGKKKPLSVSLAIAESNRRRKGEKRGPMDPIAIAKSVETRRRNRELRDKGLLSCRQ